MRLLCVHMNAVYLYKYVLPAFWIIQYSTRQIVWPNTFLMLIGLSFTSWSCPVAKSMATLMRTKKPSWRSPIVTEESIKMLRLAAQSIGASSAASVFERSWVGKPKSTNINWSCAQLETILLLDTFDIELRELLIFYNFTFCLFWTSFPMLCPSTQTKVEGNPTKQSCFQFCREFARQPGQ